MPRRRVHTMLAQQRGGYGNNYDLERNGNLVAGERYELQDRSTRQLSLNEFPRRGMFSQMMVIIAVDQ